MQQATAAALSPVQEKVAQLLAAGVPLSHAAEQAGISRQSIYHWQANSPAFAQAVNDARQHYTTQLSDQLQHLSQLALNALQQILEDPKASPGVKLRAALAILKRPVSPLKRDWNLPVDLDPSSTALLNQLDLLDAESKLARLTKLDTNSTVSTATAEPTATTADLTPRSAPCPCGSGQKYKRCCGRNAPPALHYRAA